MDGLLREPLLYSDIVESPASFMRSVRKTPSALQHTLRHAISCTGTGLHTGQSIRMSLHPAPAGHGIVFQRTDLPNAAPIAAHYDNVVETRLSTVLGEAQRPENRVATVEHLMAALNGCGIDNVLVLIDGPETPVFDGSAADFVFLLDCAGRKAQDAPRRFIEVCKPIRICHNDSWAELHPTAGHHLHLSLSIDFPAKAIGQQSYSAELTPWSFRHELANSRTFTLKAEIEALHRAGLARGGSLDNAIVVDDDHILNPSGLRKPDEFIRHKVMDAVGDLYLAGGVLLGEFRGHRSGHALNNQVLRALFADQNAWRDITTSLPAASAA